MGTLSKPRFKVIDILRPPPSVSPETPVSTLCEGFRAITEQFPFNNDLQFVLGELQCFTSVLNISTMSLPKIDRTIVSIQYQLLSYQSADTTKSSAIFDAPGLCAIGALVYLQTVHRFHLRLHSGAPSSVLMDSALIEKLKKCLDSSDTNLTQTRKLFLWMTFLGGVAVTGTKERAWFVARLAKAVVELQIRNWEEAKSSLTKFLWVDRIHEDSCMELWKEAQIIVTVLFGSSR
jgi:hypothetical protein